MAARTVDGPEQDWLDMHDLTRLLRMSESTIRRLIRQGEFPAPVEVTRGIRMWLWTDVVWWSLRVSMGSRLSAGGQEQSPPGQEPPTGEDTPPGR